MNIAQELERTLKGLGFELQGNVDEVRRYMSERMLHLSTIVDEPGYLEALKAEGLNVAMKAAGLAVDSADAVDRELVAVITGGLAVAARALV